MMDVAARSKMVMAKRGDIVTVASTEVGQAYLVKEGHLRVVRSGPRGKQISLDILQPGDVIGLTPVLTEDGDTDQVECLDDVLFCRIPAKILREVLEKTPGLALHFSKVMGLRRHKLELRLIDIAFCTVPVRLARLLLELNLRFGHSTPRGRLINLKLTHQEVADMIGSNREAANRAMAMLLDSGLVLFEGKKILILDLPALERAAEVKLDWRNVSADTTDR